MVVGIARVNGERMTIGANERSEKPNVEGRDGVQKAGDRVHCAIVYKEGKGEPWQLCARALSLEHAAMSLRDLLEQEHKYLGHKNFRAMVVSSEHYDCGRFDSPLKLPKVEKGEVAITPTIKVEEPVAVTCDVIGDIDL